MTNDNDPFRIQDGPVALIMKGRAQQAQLCDDLENIADQLGGKVDESLSRSVLVKLLQDLPLFQSDEETLFDVLRLRNKDNALLDQCLNLSLNDHQACTSYALELYEPLRDLAAGKRVFHADTFGYMLRCFFDHTRRHLNWEEVTIFGPPLSTLSDLDLENISERLALKRSV